MSSTSHLRARQLTEVTDEPITLAEARDHLRIQPYEEASDGDTHPDDALITALLAAAREHAEAFTGLAFAPRQFAIALDTLPDDADPIELPMSPVTALLTFTTDTGTSDEAEVVIDSYLLDEYHLPNRIVPYAAWPALTSTPNGVVITYLAGYGASTDAAAPLPYAARAAILLTLGHLYAHREENTETALHSLPMGVEALLRRLRVHLGLA